MNDNDLDCLLTEREEIAPSSGFVASVMEAVRQEAAAPAPIPFPWKWALPGLIASVALALGLVGRWIFAGAGASHPVSSVAAALPVERVSSWLPHAQIASSTVVALEWSAVALLVSLAAAWFSMRIAGAGE